MVVRMAQAASPPQPEEKHGGRKAADQGAAGREGQARLAARTGGADVPRVTLDLGPAKDLPKGSYFADWVFPEARQAVEWGYGEQTIETTLDDDLQRQAVNAIRRANLNGAQEIGRAHV